MSKLFNQSQSTVSVEQNAQDVHSVLPEMISEHGESIDMALEASEMALERLQTVQGMQDHLGRQKLCSVAYLNTMESYSPLVKSLGARMGVRHFPSLEDFGNKHAAQDAHDFAVEGFKEMVSKLWERIKGFFRELFKKVKLFFRRLAGANLELDNYEVYCDQLIGKLKANNAVIGDKTAMISDLPRLLCDANGAPVDSDFVLNQGGSKVKNLINHLQTMNQGPEANSLHRGVADFRKTLEGYIKDVSGGIGQSEFETRSLDIRNRAIGLMASMFPWHASNAANLPPKVTDAIRERFAGQKSPGVRTMVCGTDGLSQMPTGINMYLITADSADATPVPPSVFIASHHVASINNSLPPIASLNNLVTYHSEYKNTLAKFNDKAGNKSVDLLSSEVDKLLTLLQRSFSNLISATTPSPVQTDSAKYMVSLMDGLKVKLGPATAHAVRDIKNAVTEAVGDHNTDVALFHTFCDAYIADDPELIKTAVDEMNKNQEDMRGYIKATIVYFSSLTHMTQGASQISPEDMAVRSEMVKGLEKLLTHIFAQLQVLYRGMTVEFYKVYTELRYAVVKYIYDSAKRYSY